MFKHDNNIYYQDMDNDNKLNLFNKNLMNIFLNQFQETLGLVTYDDIVQMSTMENHDTEITNLPKNLRSLTIMSTMCNHIVFSDDVRLCIETISIDKSNITKFPNIHNCIKLKSFKINHSAITEFSIDYDLPDSLVELNLQGNLIQNARGNPFSYQKLERVTLKKNLSDNWLLYDRFPEKLRLKCNLVRQETYKHNPIGFVNVRNNHIQLFVEGLHHDEPVPEAFFASQNVHLSSINKSVMTSFNCMMEFINNNNIPLLEIYPRSLMQQIADYFDVNDVCIRNNIQLLKKNDSFVKNMLVPSVNSLTKKTYKETFNVIWAILCFKHNQQTIDLDDATHRIITEINDGRGMCFTGIYNRLLNSVVGIIEGVHIGFSESEELQLEIGKIIARLNDCTKPDYTFTKAICDVKETLAFVKDVNVKNAWFDAVYDLKPNNERIKHQNTYFWRTWDHDVLDLMNKNVVGFYNDEDDTILFIKDICI